jgi:hypothetical protein
LLLNVAVAMGLIVPSGRLAAQEIRAGLYGGAAWPSGTMAERREVGYELGGLVTLEWARWALRADLSYARHAGKEADLFNADRYPDLWNMSVLASGLYRFPGQRLRPYVMVGTGLHRMQQVDRSPNVYGWVSGVHAGAGLRVGIRSGLAVFAEVRRHLILSDYGNGDFELSTYTPLSVGVVF